MFGVSGQASEIFDKSKFEQFFDVVYVSSRAAHVVGQPFFGKILKSGEEKAVVAVETSKFLVPLSKNMRSGFNAKIEEYALKSGLNRLPQGISFSYRHTVIIVSCNCAVASSYSINVTRLQ